MKITNELTMQKKAAPTALLLDPDGKVGKLYGAKTTPHMFIINSEGIFSHFCPTCGTRGEVYSFIIVISGFIFLSYYF